MCFLIDELGWQRVGATIATGLFILLLGFRIWRRSCTPGSGWLDDVDYIVSNWILPLGGLGVALFVGYRLRAVLLEEAFQSTRGSWAFPFWSRCWRPAVLLAIFLNHWCACSDLIQVRTTTSLRIIGVKQSLVR